MLKYLFSFALCLFPGLAFGQTSFVFNATPFTGTPIGAGYTFSGINSTLFAANIAAYQSMTVPFSTSMWTHFPTLGSSTSPYFLNALDATGLNGFAVWAPIASAQTTDSLRLSTYLQPGTSLTCISANKLCANVSLINDNGLHHLCASWSLSGSSFYVDGILRSPLLSGAAMTASTNTTSWIIGSNMPTGNSMVDLAVWTRSLSGKECTTIYNRGAAGFSLLSGNAPASLSSGLLAYWSLSNCTGTNPVVCPDSSPAANDISNDPAPTLVLTVDNEPTGSTGVTGTVPIAATCTDAVSVTSVAFSVDGLPVSTDTTLPYSVNFDTTLLLDANNPHTATAVCTNKAGVTTTVNNVFSTLNGIVPPKTYFLNVAANGGSDSNNGLARTVSGGNGPWLTPNHFLRCGDTILAQPSQVYGAGNFTTFGTVWSCPTIGSTTGPFWARLSCELATGIQDCFISSSTTYGMRMNKDNWSIENWHIVATGIAQCIRYDPVAIRSPLPTGYPLGYQFPIYTRILNNYLDSCGRGATPGYTDYTELVGNLVYNSAYHSEGICDSGITGLAPFDFNPSDTSTHMLIAGNFIINNGNAPGCTDGEGIILDDWNQGGSTTHPTNSAGSSQQLLITQNLIFGNSSYGIEINTTNQVTNGVSLQVQVSPKYLTHNTLWGDGLGGGPGNQSTLGHGAGGSEFGPNSGNSCGTGCTSEVRGVTWDHNISVGTAWKFCRGRNAPFTCPPDVDVIDFYTISGGCTTGYCTIQNSWSWVSMMSTHADVRLATTAALPAHTYNNGAAGVGATLTATSPGALTVDGVSVSGGDRILVNNEVDKTTNGIYVATNPGGFGVAYVLTRASDANTILAGVPGSVTANASQTPVASPTQLSFGVVVNVTAGSVNAGKTYMENTKSLTAFGTSLITWGNTNALNRSFIPPPINLTEADPVFASPAQLNAGSAGHGGSGTITAINCSTSMTAYACIHKAGFDTNFTPTATGTATMGYHAPSASCFSAGTPGYELDFTLWPAWVQGTLGSSGTYVTLPCGF